MADVKIISVNPGKKTPGALNFEFIGRMARTCRPVGKVIKTERLKSVCNSIFGINRSVTNVGSIKLLTIRFFIAAFLIANGILGIHSGVKVSPVDISLFNIIAGSMIFLGFFARVASTAGIVIYTYAAVSHAVGLPPVSPSPEGYGPDFLAISQALLFLFLAITGPGRYCIDQIIRRQILLIARRRRRQSENL